MSIAWVAIALIVVIIGALLLAPMPERLTKRINPDEVRKRVRERRRLLRVYWWLVAGIVLVAIARTEIPLVNRITDRSVDFYKAALWPGVVLILLLAFGRQIIRLLRSATLKSITIGNSAFSLELTTEDVRRTLDELASELADPANALQPEETRLLKTILEADGTRSVGDIYTGFQRNTEEHRRLRKLRELNLARPIEGGKWESHKHPVATRFGRLVYHQVERLRSAS